MEISKIINEERVRSGREALLSARETYIENRSVALEGIDVEKFKDELRKIRETSINELENLLKEAKKNLMKNKINVYLARDAKDAKREIMKLIKDGELIVKSKSNVIQEIGLKEEISKKAKVIETDCGDFLVELCDEKAVHPVTPALHLSPKKIVEKIREKFDEEVKSDAKSIVQWISKKVRDYIFKADIGLSGANVISADGGIFIVENEGNVSLVSRVPEKHIIVTGIEKVVPTMEDAIKICEALSIWGTGTRLVSYINVIGSPSKTADISKEVVFGAQGAKEVHLILVDNGRRKLIENGLSEALYCINCGACLYYCPIYKQLLDYYGLNYLGGIGIIKTAFEIGLEEAFERGLYFCTTCATCKKQCPLSIDIPELLRKVRELSAKKGIVPKEYIEVRKRILKFGNPYEGLKDVEKKWYCC